MNLIDRVLKVLGHYPEVRFRRDGDCLDVSPSTPDGFHVSISTENGSRVVHYEGWHEDFDNDDDALNYFMIGHTPTARLKITRRGTCDHKWTAEIREGIRWESQGTVGLIFFPFWRRKQNVTLQNHWLEAPEVAPKK